jgi:hypothetical protein
MSLGEKAHGLMGSALADRLSGERPGAARAAAGAAVAGGITSVIVFRLLRKDES